MERRKGITPSSDLGYYISRLRKAMSNQVHRRFLEENLDLRLDQWLILMKLRMHQNVTQNYLAELIHRDKGTITRGLKKLIELNLVTKKVDAADKRSNVICITSKGVEWHKRGLEIVDKLMFKTGKEISKKEMDTCRSVLDKMYNNLLELNIN